MSNEPQIEDGGGGSTTTTTTTTTESDGTTRITIALPRTLQNLVASPTAWIIAMLTSLTIHEAAQLLQVKSPVAILIDDYLFQTVLLPIATELFISVFQMLDALILIGFGSDRQVGITPGSQPGIADLPIALITPFVFGIYQTALAVYTAVALFNETIASGLPGLGVLAPAFVTFLWAVEITVIGYVLWVMLAFIPVVNVRGVLLSLLSPFRRLSRRLL